MLDIKMPVRPFVLTFDNSKKRKPGTELQSYTSTGVVFVESGHVALDTQAARPCYASMEELKEQLAWWGKTEIEWLLGDVEE